MAQALVLAAIAVDRRRLTLVCSRVRRRRDGAEGMLGDTRQTAGSADTFQPKEIGARRQKARVKSNRELLARGGLHVPLPELFSVRREQRHAILVEAGRALSLE